MLMPVLWLTVNHYLQCTCIAWWTSFAWPLGSRSVHNTEAEERGGGGGEGEETWDCLFVF